MKGTGITRRIAVRAYQQWADGRAERELENVRVMAGEAEFENHRDDLTSLAVMLDEHIAFPEYPEFDSDAETYFNILMEREIIKFPADGVLTMTEDRKKERIRRQNRLLLESLKIHTAETIDWNLLQKWMDGRESCYQVFPGFKELVGKAIHDDLNHFSGLELWITGYYSKEKIIEILKSEILHVMWKGIAAGEIEAAQEMLISRDAGEDGITQPRDIIGGHTFIQNTGDEINPANVDRCCDIVSQAWNYPETREMLAAAGRMREVIAEFDEKLEPLVLRPLIIRTRCRICVV